MRALLPSGRDVRAPATVGKTYAVVAGLFAVVFVFPATWLKGWGVGVIVPAVILGSYGAAVVVWYWFVPTDGSLSYSRAAACGALVGVLSHLFVGPLFVVTVFVFEYAYGLLLLENLFGSEFEFWMEPSWFAVGAALLYSVAGIIATAGVPILLAVGTALLLASRQR